MMITMYILHTALYHRRSTLFDAQDRSGMRRNYIPYQVVSRGGKERDNKSPHGALETRMQKGRSSLRRWLILLFVFLLTSLIIINTYTSGQLHLVRFGSFSNVSAHENYEQMYPLYVPEANSGYLVRNKGCRIPAMDPFDPAIKRFIEKEKPLKCEYGSYPPLIESNNSAVFVNAAGRDYVSNGTERIQCCWRSFWRTKHEDNAVTYDKECYSFEESATVNAEFAKVECTRGGEQIYKDYHAFLPRKATVEERCRRAKKNIIPNGDRLSVLIVGLDSVSRLNFHRMMPKTVKSLKALDAVEMLGYNKVADNTYPNLVPVLAGLSQDELQARCWKDHKKPFDDCPFIWKNFSAAGYRTVFGEDACEMTTFNYLKPGFRSPPTDYYLRPYCIATERDIGNTCKLNANLCVGVRKTYENLLNYTAKVAREFTRDLYFAFFWQASLTHDFFNYPQLGDASYSEFVDNLKRERLLERTALIVMSDHGMRWGSFRQTYQGRTEDSLPFVFIVLPTWWKENYPLAWSNLRRNARKLTTGYDLHQTLFDILHPNVLNEKFLKERTKVLSKGLAPRGISWFLTVPDDRTCNTADIPGHWCMCHTSTDIPFNNTGLQESVEYLITKLNDMLVKYPQCAILKLKSINDAKAWKHNSDGASWIDYTVAIQTDPGDAIFEGSVRFRSDDKTRNLIGSIGRLNAYGKQSACVDEYNMRLYCYCR